MRTHVMAHFCLVVYVESATHRFGHPVAVTFQLFDFDPLVVEPAAAVDPAVTHSVFNKGKTVLFSMSPAELEFELALELDQNE